MLDVVFKISVWLNVFRSLEATYGTHLSIFANSATSMLSTLNVYLLTMSALLGTECINGSFRTLGITEAKPQVEPLVDQLKYVDDLVEICCRVRANPAARILWLYEGKVITGENGQRPYRYAHCNETLTIKYVMLSDAGRYTCQATNAHGKDSSTGMLKVKIKDKSVYTPKAYIKRKQTPRLGENVILTCENNAGKNFCSWYRNNQTIDVKAEDRYCGASCHLLVRNFTSEKDGVYKCEVGDLTAELTLTVNRSELNGGHNKTSTGSGSGFWSCGTIAVLPLTTSLVLLHKFTFQH